MSDQTDEMIPDEVDIEQWFPKPQPSPFTDNNYGPKNRIGRSNWIAEEAIAVSPQTSPPLQDVFHPFKIVIADGNAYVFPGYVYGNNGTRMFQRIIPKISTNELGNPLYGGTLRSLTLSEQFMWIKVTITAMAITAAEIVYSSEASATDSSTTKYILIGKTFTDGTIEQYLKENAFVSIQPTSNLLWNITNTSIEGDARATIADGVLLVSEYQPISTDGSWSGIRVLKRVSVSGTEFTGLTTGQHIWLKIDFDLSSSSSYRAQLQAVDDSIPDTYTTGDASSGTSHTHEITLKSGGANEIAAQLLTARKQYSAHSFVVNSSEQTDTDNSVYVKIATVTVASSAVTNISQYVAGCPITVPLVSVTYGDGVGD